MSTVLTAPASSPACAPAPAVLQIDGVLELHDLAATLRALAAEVEAKAKHGAPLASVARFGAALREHAAESDRITGGETLGNEQERFRNAVDRLNRSERGHAALVRFRKLLEAGEGYAMGLDNGNWQALENVVRGCRVFGAHNCLNFLPRK